MANHNNEIEKRLWDAADELRANSKLKASEYSVPVLGLIFLASPLECRGLIMQIIYGYRFSTVH